MLRYIEFIPSSRCLIRSKVVSVAEEGSTAIGAVKAVSEDGADAEANLAVKAEGEFDPTPSLDSFPEGATVNATAEAKGEGEGAVAIVDSIAKASKN